MANTALSSFSKASATPDLARNSYFDLWKGIAIIAVVAIHSLEWSAKNTPEFAAELALAQFIYSPVALFLMLAGYFSFSRHEVTIVQYYSRRVVRLLPPYLIWSLLAFAVYYPAAIYHPKDAIYCLLTGRAIQGSVYYFIIVLAQLTLLAPFIMRIRSRRLDLWLIWLVTPLALAITYYLRIYYPSSRFASFPDMYLFFPIWYSFFHFGIYARKYNLAENQVLKSRIFTYLSGAFLCLLIGVAGAQLLPFNIATSQLQFSVFGYNAFIGLLIFAGAGIHSTASNWLQWLGRASFGIYLMHIFIISLINNHAQFFVAFPAASMIFMLIKIIVSLTICSFFIWIFRRLLPRLAPYLGF